MKGKGWGGFTSSGISLKRNCFLCSRLRWVIFVCKMKLRRNGCFSAPDSLNNRFLEVEVFNNIMFWKWELKFIDHRISKSHWVLFHFCSSQSSIANNTCWFFFPSRFGFRTGELRRKGWRKMPVGRGGVSTSATWSGQGEALNRTRTASKRRAWTATQRSPSQVEMSTLKTRSWPETIQNIYTSDMLMALTCQQSKHTVKKVKFLLEVNLWH